MNDTAIHARGIGKEYRLASLRGQSRPFCALREVGFRIRQGEVVGIIGRNGAGKSTLLKILSRITAPTRGRALIRGRVGSLLEVGTGFHPELTGRENIFLNGAVLGMTRRQIKAAFDDIVCFAEVERFLDTPVKRYSSGMYVRLAFAVAAHLQPEILIVDEVLAVGDAAFQKKCLDRMSDVAQGGRTVLFVSHNMAAVGGLCQRAILLDHGQVMADGPSESVIRQYVSLGQSMQQIPLADRTDRQGNGALRFTGLCLTDAGGQPASTIQSGQSLTIAMDYRTESPSLRDASFSVAIYNHLGQYLMMLNNEMVGQEYPLLPSCGHVDCLIPRLPLAAGQYWLNIHASVKGQMADWIQQAIVFQVEAGDFYGTGRLPPTTHGGLLAAHQWSRAA